jgi:hypothetical protein
LARDASVLAVTNSAAPALRRLLTPNSNYRALVTPAKYGKGNKRQEISTTDDGTPANRHAAMTGAKRLRRVFNINITICKECGGADKVIASVEDLGYENK